MNATMNTTMVTTRPPYLGDIPPTEECCTRAEEGWCYGCSRRLRRGLDDSAFLWDIKPAYDNGDYFCIECYCKRASIDFGSGKPLSAQVRESPFIPAYLVNNDDDHGTYLHEHELMLALHRIFDRCPSIQSSALRAFHALAISACTSTTRRLNPRTLCAVMAFLPRPANNLRYCQERVAAFVPTWTRPQEGPSVAKFVRQRLMPEARRRKRLERSREAERSRNADLNKVSE